MLLKGKVLHIVGLTTRCSHRSLFHFYRSLFHLPSIYPSDSMFQKDYFLYFFIDKCYTQALSLKKSTSLSWTNTRTRLPRAAQRKETLCSWQNSEENGMATQILISFYFCFQRSCISVLQWLEVTHVGREYRASDLQLLVCCFYSGFKRHELV